MANTDPPALTGIALLLSEYPVAKLDLHGMTGAQAARDPPASRYCLVSCDDYSMTNSRTASPKSRVYLAVAAWL